MKTCNHLLGRMTVFIFLKMCAFYGNYEQNGKNTYTLIRTYNDLAKITSI